MGKGRVQIKYKYIAWKKESRKIFRGGNNGSERRPKASHHSYECKTNVHSYCQATIEGHPTVHGTVESQDKRGKEWMKRRGTRQRFGPAQSLGRRAELGGIGRAGGRGVTRVKMLETNKLSNHLVVF